MHTRAVTKHTCESRKRCDCRPRPCHPGKTGTCPHGRSTVCFARHELGDQVLGQPLCLDCYDYDWQAVWNHQAGELWRRTTMAVLRAIRRTAKKRGIDPASVKVGFGKVAEMQRRGVVHFHAVLRLDGHDPDDPGRVLQPPDGLVLDDLADAVNHAAKTTMFVTGPHPDKPSGWVIGWGTQLDIRTINLGTDGAITDGMVAGYLSKYATKATEATGHTSRRLTSETIDVYADPDGGHTERLVEACWILGRDKDWSGLRRWAHMLGFGGHFLTKSRHYSVTFRLLRQERVVWQQTLTAGPEQTEPVEAHRPGRQLPRLRRRRLAHHRRRHARQHRRRKSPRATTDRPGGADHRLGELTAQPSSPPCTHSLLENSTVDMGLGATTTTLSINFEIERSATMDVRQLPGRHMTLAQVCEELGISRSTFYDWRAKRKAPPCIKLPNGDLRIRRADFEEWLAELDEAA